MKLQIIALDATIFKSNVNDELACTMPEYYVSGDIQAEGLYVHTYRRMWWR